MPFIASGGLRGESPDEAPTARGGPINGSIYLRLNPAPWGWSLDDEPAFPGIRTADRDYREREEVSGPGEKHSPSGFPIHKPRHDSLWPVLLEPGMPALPGRISDERRAGRYSSQRPGLQDAGCGRNGDRRTGRRAEMDVELRAEGSRAKAAPRLVPRSKVSGKSC